MVVWEVILGKKISNCLSALISSVLYITLQHLWLHCNELWSKSVLGKARLLHGSCRRKGYVSMREFCQVLDHSFDAPELANTIQKLLDRITVALIPNRCIRLACRAHCACRASVGLVIPLFCLPVVILCDLYFFSCLMCLYLIRSWFCPSCLLFNCH